MGKALELKMEMTRFAFLPECVCVVCEKEPCSVTRSSLRAEATVACVTDENGSRKEFHIVSVCLSH